MRNCKVFNVIIYLLLYGYCTCFDGPPLIKEHPLSIIARRNDPATLNCAAAGAQRIQWFRNGHPVESSEQNHKSHRIQLKEGSLFFLRVTAGKRDNDAGVYWCVALNAHGATRSRNATLTIASLEDTFVYSESDKSVKSGDSVKLKCRPPRGVPKPSVVWKQNEEVKLNSSRVYTTHDGDLVFERVIETDAGEYVCVADNNAGSRQSPPMTLLVTRAPWFREKPANITTVKGSSAELYCSAGGSPTPSISWRKLDGQIPLGRTHVLEHETLRITDLEASDSGLYLCEARNSAGNSVAKGRINVFAPPEVKEKPQSALVLIKNTVVLKCKVHGDPKPLIVWRVPAKTLPMHLIPSTNTSRAFVSPDGSTLTLNDLQKDDSGSYICWGVSSGGGISTRSNIVVIDAYPPPLIGIRPKDKIVSSGSTVIFPCEAVSENVPHNVTWWHQEASHLEKKQVTANNRNSLLATGTLILRDVKSEDAGIYTCHINSIAGTVDTEAILKIDNDFKIYVENQGHVPAPPSKPKVISVNDTAIKLSWHPNSRVTPKTNKYKIEYWRSPWPEWRLATAEVIGDEAVIEELSPNTAYVFSIRAINGLKESFPSPWSDVVYTSKNPSTINIKNKKGDIRKISDPSVYLLSVDLIASNSALVTWKIFENSDVPVDGVTVYALGNEEIRASTVLGTSSTTYTLQNLQLNTEYTFFLVPFWKSIEGTPSNAVTVSTITKGFDKSPYGITLERYNSNSALIRWKFDSSLEKKIIGYRILINFNGTSIEEESDYNFFEIHKMIADQYYSVKVAYVTAESIGPWSYPEIISVPATLPDIVNTDIKEVHSNFHPAWILYILLPLFAFILGAILLYIRFIRRKQVPPLDAPAIYADGSIRSPHMINMYGEQKLWRPESDKESSVSSTRLIKPEHLVNEYAEPRIRHTSDATEPYATTALLAPSSPRMYQSSPSWKYREVPVNWGAILPPPPVGPPPGTHESSSSDSSPMHSNYDNGASSEQYDHPCESGSEHTYDIYTPSPELTDGPTFYVVKAGSVKKLPVSQFVRHDVTKNNTH